MKRRIVVVAVCIVLVSLAGCAGLAESGTGTPTGTDTDAPTDTDTDAPTRSETPSPTTSDEPTDTASALTDWERATDCEGEYDGMHDSVLRVEDVTTDLDAAYAPIHFSNLTDDEQAILRPVTEEDGYGTCDASEAFDRFVDRVIDAAERQEEDDAVYLERNGTYYRLYVEVTDQVYAY
jgi:hypothetical protein